LPKCSASEFYRVTIGLSFPVNTGSMPTGSARVHVVWSRERGFFTSAIASKKGLLKIADRGTLFLDEIATHESGKRRPKFCAFARSPVYASRRSAGDSGGCGASSRPPILTAPIGAGRPLPRRFVLPPERDHDRVAAAAPAQKKTIPLLVQFFLKKYGEENDRPVRRITPESTPPI